MTPKPDFFPILARFIAQAPTYLPRYGLYRDTSGAIGRVGARRVNQNSYIPVWVTAMALNPPMDFGNLQFYTFLKHSQTQTTSKP